jgi:tRNA-binding protein
MITFDDFQKVDIRVGKVLEVEDFSEAKNPSYKLKIDFGPEIGIKRSSAQITRLYKKEDLKGKLVLAVVNFPPKQIANFKSEVLVLGVPDKNHDVVLVKPDKEVDIGVRLY